MANRISIPSGCSLFSSQQYFFLGYNKIYANSDLLKHWFKVYYNHIVLLDSSMNQIESLGNNLQMTDFVGSNNNSTKSAGVLDDSDRIHLFETLIYDTRSTHVRET